VKRRLRDAGLLGRVAKKKPYLRQKKIKMGKEHRHWTEEPHGGGVIIPIKLRGQTGKWFQTFFHHSFLPLGILETLQIRAVYRVDFPWCDVLITMSISLGHGDFYQYILLYLLSDSKMLFSIKLDIKSNFICHMQRIQQV
jgi:hypothetical protein